MTSCILLALTLSTSPAAPAKVATSPMREPHPAPMPMPERTRHDKPALPEKHKLLQNRKAPMRTVSDEGEKDSEITSLDARRARANQRRNNLN